MQAAVLIVLFIYILIYQFFQGMYMMRTESVIFECHLLNLEVLWVIVYVNLNLSKKMKRVTSGKDVQFMK